MSNGKLAEKGTGMKMGLGNAHPAVIAVWAALISAAHMLPAIPMIGTGGTFSVSSALIPLAGIFFGPVAGAICASIGSFIGQIIAPHIAWLGLATFLISTVNAFVAGYVSRGKWPIGVGIIVLGTILWYSNDIGRQAPVFPIVYYGLGIIMAIVGGIFGYKWLTAKSYLKKFAGIWLAAFAGFIGAAALANYACLIVLKLPATVWKALTFIAPIERTIFAVGAAIIGIPLLIGLPKIGIFVGPDADVADTDEEE